MCALLTPLESYRLISETHFWLLRYDNKIFLFFWVLTVKRFQPIFAPNFYANIIKSNKLFYFFYFCIFTFIFLLDCLSEKRKKFPSLRFCFLWSGKRLRLVTWHKRVYELHFASSDSNFFLSYFGWT